MISIMSDTLSDRLFALPGRYRSVPERDALFHRGETIKFLHVIVTGSIELSRATSKGSLIVMQRLAAGTVIAEASLYSDRYHCDAKSLTASRVFSVTRRRVLQELHRNMEFSNCWNASLAAEVQALRMRNEILRLRTVCDRLNAWLAWTDKPLPPRGKWNGIANEIGVSAEALYRELSARKQ